MREWALAAIASVMVGGAASAAEQPWTLQAALGPPKGLTLSGSARARYEVLDGQVRPGFGRGEDIIVLRTILTADYRTGPLHFGLEVYDSRAYGADRGGVLSTSDVNTLEPVQAYVAADLGPVFGAGTGANLQLGRMMLNVGSRRLIAADDYRNTTNGYTGAKLELKGRAGTAATLIYAVPQVRLPEDVAGLRSNRVRLDRDDGNLQLWGGVAAKSGLLDKALLELEYIGFDEKDDTGRPTRDRRLRTVGARLFRAPEAGRIDYEFEGFRQTGSVSASLAPAAASQDVAAGFVHGEFGWQFGGAWKPHLALEYDWAQGDRPGGRYSRFDTLYGMRRADYAQSGLLNAIGRANSRVAGVRLEATPSPRLDFMAHYAAMDQDAVTDAFSTTGVRDPAGGSGRFAGHLVEGRLRYWLVPRAVRFEANGAYIAKGRFLKTAPNAPRTGDTRYVSASVTATF